MKHIASWIRECDEAAFDLAFRPYPDIRIWNARTTALPNRIHGLLLTGGSDISREFLHQPVYDSGLIRDPDPERDIWEFAVVQHALNQRLPLFAICRGMQILNVALGGTLHLDIPGHDNNAFRNIQSLRYSDGIELQIPAVNSSHHQAINEPGAGLRVEARCAEDDLVEQVRLSGHPFALAVQYHPERDHLYQPLFEDFADHIRGHMS